MSHVLHFFSLDLGKAKCVIFLPAKNAENNSKVQFKKRLKLGQIQLYLADADNYNFLKYYKLLLVLFLVFSLMMLLSLVGDKKNKICLTDCKN
jgi:hypothetical protein